MILSCCPGGVTVNIITKPAKGDTALSISYTAVVSIITMFTLALVTGFSVAFSLGAEAPPVSVLSLRLDAFALPSGVYGTFMYLVCLPVVFLYVRWLNRKPVVQPG